MNNDVVFVQGLQLDASVGVFDWEKQIRQRLRFDLELYTDFSAAAQSDAIADAVDYAAVCERIQNVISLDHYQLLERLAETIIRALFEQFRVERIVLSLHKPGAVPGTDSVGVKVDRWRGSH
jgi:7,8-dihydroneopterin aldolase/epimerase/oxygenase